jgi:STE24 endopeptidase
MFQSLTIIFFIIILFGFISEKVLEFLNASWYSKPIPLNLKKYFEEDDTRGLKYKKAKFRYSLLNSSISFILTLAFWWLGGFGWTSSLVVLLTDYVILQNLLFFGLIALFSGIISLPFSWYYHFVLEEKFGFNKMTLKTFLGDLVKSMLLSVLLGGLILAFIVWVYLENPQQFWWIVWIVMSAFMIFMTAFYARLIVPIFNKQTELEDGDLKVAIHQLAVKLGFQLENIYIIDGSKRSTKANAYFTGLGSQKRIVLYDTLIKDLEEPEILAVLAHEVGHYKHKHTLSNIVLGLLQTGVMLFILSLFINPDSETALVLNQVVARDLTIVNTHFYLGIIGFGILYTPVSTLLGLLMNVLSRKFEYQADAFAANAELEEALKMGLIKLSKNSLSNLNPHPAYVFVNYSHPPLLARLQALEKMEKR